MMLGFLLKISQQPLIASNGPRVFENKRPVDEQNIESLNLAGAPYPFRTHSLNKYFLRYTKIQVIK
jgi:hypothetical protein